MPSTNKGGLDIIIVGAGLGGLAASISCSLAGHKVTILERAPELAVIGAGLQLSPNSTRILDAWGLTPSLEKCWAEVEVLIVRRYSDGSILYEDDNWIAKMRQNYGAPFVDVHRGELQTIMYRHALNCGVQIRLGEEVESINTELARVNTTSGHTYEGDLVVGADGLWSKSREALLGRKDDPQPTGDLAYRILLDMNDLTDPDVRNVITRPGNNIWIGPGSHVIGYPVKAGTLFNLVLLRPDNMPQDVRIQQGDLAEMTTIFKNWDPRLSDLLSKVKSVQKWKLLHLSELEAWSNSKGNFVLLGDSCHPMLPYLAQGASSAIEDGAALGTVLQSVKSVSDLPAAIGIWERLRKPRGEAIARGALEQRRNFHLADGPEQQERDAVMRTYREEEIRSKRFPYLWADPEFQHWLFAYDAIREAAAAVR